MWIIDLKESKIKREGLEAESWEGRQEKGSKHGSSAFRHEDNIDDIDSVNLKEE